MQVLQADGSYKPEVVVVCPPAENSASRDSKDKKGCQTCELATERPESGEKMPIDPKPRDPIDPRAPIGSKAEAVQAEAGCE